MLIPGSHKLFHPYLANLDAIPGDTKFDIVMMMSQVKIMVSWIQLGWP